MGKEFELKYKADDAVLTAIHQEYGDFTLIPMETSYYDTKDRKLGALRWTLRRRLERDVSICCLKTPGTNLIRGEWEVEAGTIEEGMPALCRLDVPREFPGLIASGLEQVCGARFLRRAKLVETPSGSVEIALDRGLFLGGGKIQPFAEVEVELKSGSRADAEAFGLALSQKYGLETETVSKFERALALTGEVR